MKFLPLLAALLSLSAVSSALGQADHSLPGLNASIASAAVQPNGKVIVSGPFTTFSGVRAANLARLKPDGTLDSAFQLDAAASTSPLTQNSPSLAIQPDGKVLVFGASTKIFGVVQKDLIRLNSNGSLDTAFNAAASLDFQGVGLAVGQADGGVLADTGFDRFGGAAPGNYRLVRLRADGSEDAGFQAAYFTNPSLGFPRGAQLSAVAVLPGGKILVAGNFSAVNGVAHVALARLNADGSLDESFVPAFGLHSLDASSPLTVSAVFPRTDGTLAISGTFTEIGGAARAGFAVLNADGTLDGGFTPDDSLSGAAGEVIGVQSDGKILLTQINVSTGFKLSLQLERLNADGSLDAGFTSPSVSRAIMAGTGNALGLYGARELPNGAIVAAGNFDGINATARSSVALFNADGTLNLGRAQSVVDVTAQSGGFLLTRTSGDKTMAVTVRYTLKGSAAAGVDYASLSGSAKLKAGKTKKAVNVTPLSAGTTIKAVKLTLVAGDGYTVGQSKKAKHKLAAGP